jgi:phosphoribosylformylglycinamidine synthase PurS subunit
MAGHRFAVDVMPKPGILDPQGRAVEQSLPHLHVEGVHGVRVGRRIELTVDAPSEAEARAVVERLAGELFANPLIESWTLEPVGGGSSMAGPGPSPVAAAGPGRQADVPGTGRP